LQLRPSDRQSHFEFFLNPEQDAGTAKHSQLIANAVEFAPAAVGHFPTSISAKKL
jgi:hypothetical protein